VTQIAITNSVLASSDAGAGAILIATNRKLPSVLSVCLCTTDWHCALKVCATGFAEGVACVADFEKGFRKKEPKNASKSFRVALSLLGVGIAAGVAHAQTAPEWPDTFVARVKAVAIVETLDATLLAARSATLTLDKWCADHKLGSETKIRARLVRDIDKPVTAEQRHRLQIDETEPVKFCHVELRCGDRILSEADNWYVPSRLTAEMNHQLETTDNPFGRAVADLKPLRQTFAAEMLWKPLDDGWLGAAPADRRPSAAGIDHSAENFPASRIALYARSQANFGSR
jgi:hypothetical protein